MYTGANAGYISGLHQDPSCSLTLPTVASYPPSDFCFAFSSNPAQLKPGMLLNIGVVYRVPRLQSLPILAKYLHTTPSAIRRLNPDVREDDEMIGAFTWNAHARAYVRAVFLRAAQSLILRPR